MKSSTDSASAGGPGLILVVDDEPELCDLVCLQLKLDGFAVASAEGGEAAFEIFQQRAPALVISDIRMPGGDGIALLQRIRSSARPHVPVILMTGYSDTDKERAQQLGATELLMKPFRLDLLVATVRDCLAAVSSAP